MLGNLVILSKSAANQSKLIGACSDEWNWAGGRKWAEFPFEILPRLGCIDWREKGTPFIKARHS